MQKKSLVIGALVVLELAGCGAEGTRTNPGDIVQLSCTPSASISQVKLLQLEKAVKGKIIEVCGGFQTFGYAGRLDEVRHNVSTIRTDVGIFNIQSTLDNLLSDTNPYSLAK